MIKFEILTIFPEAFDSYFSYSIIARAQKKKLIKINIYNLRDFTKDLHRRVDDRPYGGGAGMILKVEPIFLAIRHIISQTRFIKQRERKIILLSPRGEKFNQNLARQLSGLKQIVFICGHYEGVDERVAKYIADKTISIGDYILTGGELPAMVMIDAITRLIPKAIKEESLKEESFSLTNSRLQAQKEYPQYTRPAVFEPRKFIKKPQKYPPRFFRAKLWKVPEVLLSGNHQKIQEWRRKNILE